MSEQILTRVFSLLACCAVAVFLGHRFGFEVGLGAFFVLGLLSDIKFGIGKS